MFETPENQRSLTARQSQEQQYTDDTISERLIKSSILLFGCATADSMFANGVSAKNFIAGVFLGTMFALTDDVYRENEVN